jgi:hypothetical protein
MTGSTMFNVAYGLGCDSKDDPTLIRMEKLMKAASQAALPTQFLAVSIPFRYTHDKSFEFANLLESVSSFEVPSFMDAWWIIQEVG